MAKQPKAAKRAKTDKRAKPRRRINRGLTALVAVVFALVAGAAGLIYWLASTYDPNVDPYGRSILAETDTQPETDKAEVALTPGNADDRDDTAAHDADAATHSTTDADGNGDGQRPAEAGHDDGGNGQAAMSKPDADDPGDKPEDQGHSDNRHAEHGDTENGPAAGAPATSDQAASGTDAQETTGAGAEAVADDETNQIASLPPAPLPELVKESPNGPLPVIAPDGRTPLAVYARPYERSGRPRIAVVLTELGMAEAKTIAAIQQLPGPITLAFHPYGRNLQDYVNQARAAGHEVLLELPMEPLNANVNDPGHYALLTSLPTRTNLERLDWLLGRFSGYVGVVNFMGDRFTTSEPHIRPILEAVRGRGLMFLDRRSSARSIAADVARDIGLPGVASDRQIDTQAARTAIGGQLRELERLATGNGQAVGMAYPYPVTIELLSEWARGLRAKGIDLVPASALVRVTG